MEDSRPRRSLQLRDYPPAITQEAARILDRLITKHESDVERYVQRVDQGCPEAVAWLQDQGFSFWHRLMKCAVNVEVAGDPGRAEALFARLDELFIRISRAVECPERECETRDIDVAASARLYCKHGRSIPYIGR